MRVWLIYNKRTRETMHMVFASEKLANAYKEKYGNDWWLVEYVELVSDEGMI